MNLLDTDVPPLGMGCWAIGGQFYAGDNPHGFPDIDDQESIKTVHAALDAGVRVFDTAAVYGAGHSERLLGRALQNRQDAIIVSKLGTSFDEDAKTVLHDETEAFQVAPAIDASLRRLNRDRIDVMLLHLNALPIPTAQPIFDEMERARQAGKIRSYGWSTDFPTSTRAMATMPGFVGIEHAMNLFVDVPTIQATVDELELVAFLRSPLAMGLLTGKFDKFSVMPAGDVRSVNNEKRDYFRNGKAASTHLDNLEAIRELLRTDGRTLAQGALGWLMAKSSRNMPIPGARNHEQMIENAKAIEFGPLPGAVMDEIESKITREPEGLPRAR